MFPFNYGEPVKDCDLQEWVVSTTGSDAIKESIRKSNLAFILGQLIEAFYQQNAACISTRVAETSEGQYIAFDAFCELDNAAARLSKSPEELQVFKGQGIHREAVEAAQDGIVYWK